MFSFIRRLLGRETMADVAGVWDDQLNVVKIILCRWFTAEFRKLPNMEQEVPPVLAVAVVNYLTGEDLRDVNDSCSETARAIINTIRDDVPEIAGNLMRQDRPLREVVVNTLRMRLVLNLHFKPDAARATGFKGRAEDLLLQYGAEFPEEPSPSRFNALVYKLASWAQGPDFPGLDE